MGGCVGWPGEGNRTGTLLRSHVACGHLTLSQNKQTHCRHARRVRPLSPWLRSLATCVRLQVSVRSRGRGDNVGIALRACRDGMSRCMGVWRGREVVFVGSRGFCHGYGGGEACSGIT